MKKVVLLISMLLCASLLVGCANMLEGLTKKEQKLNNLGIPVGEYKCVDAVADNGKRPNIQSTGAYIGTNVINQNNINLSDEGLCFYGSSIINRFTLTFLPHGQIAKIVKENGVNTPKVWNDITWEYKEEALFIVYTNTDTTTYKFVLV